MRGYYDQEELMMEASTLTDDELIKSRNGMTRDYQTMLMEAGECESEEDAAEVEYHFFWQLAIDEEMQRRGLMD